MAERFADDGCVVVGIAEAADWSAVLERQRLALMASGAANRPWLFWELHNPWSRAAAYVDSWQLLDICHDPALVGALAALAGDDIVLFDSQIIPNPALSEFDQSTWRNDRVFFPLNADGGIVVRLPFGFPGARMFEHRRDETRASQYSDGQILIHSADIDYRSSAVNGSGNFEYVIRFFPADLRFLRDPQHAKHVALTDRYPWINYTRLPLWLVSGQDRAGNDFVTGFHTRTGRWTTARLR